MIALPAAPDYALTATLTETFEVPALVQVRNSLGAKHLIILHLIFLFNNDLVFLGYPVEPLILKLFLGSSSIDCRFFSFAFLSSLDRLR